MHAADLERLASRLQQLRDHLRRAPGGQPLDAGDDLVREAESCDFMLPSPLTVQTLAETVDRKIANVALLLERARRHENLPDDAQLVAEQEYLASEADWRAARRHEQDAGTRG